MFITIRNLPHTVKLKDIKKLINEKCLITDVILGELIREDETATKKITIGLADECDAAIVFRKLDGFHFNGQALIVEDTRKKKGPVPGELNPMQYHATSMHLQTQVMVPGYNAMGMMSTGFYNPMQAMMQPAVLDPNAFGFVQPMLGHDQPITGHQPIQQMSPPRQQMSQQRQQTSQPRQQMSQPRQQMSQPRHQINQPRHQINQPRRKQFDQQGPSRPSHGEPRNPEPYKKAVVHQQVLDWDIPSREVVFKTTDPVWGVRVQKQSQTAPNDFELENSSNRMSGLHRPTSRWNDHGSANHNDDNNLEPYVTDNFSHNKGQDYNYSELSIHNEAYADSYCNDSYANPQQYNVNQGYSQYEMASHEPVWEMNQDHYDTFAENNRKRTYSETRSNEFQNSNVNTAYEGNMHKRNKPDYYDPHAANEMEVGYVDESADLYNDDDIETAFDPNDIKGPQYLSFNKFRFSFKLPIAKFKAFENYMFANLISKRFPVDIKSYNVMYVACRIIWKRMCAFLGINLRKYSYYLLNYIQLTIERVMGDRIYNPKRWKHKLFVDAFLTKYTYQSFFLEFKSWFENYAPLEFKETPQFKAAMSSPRPAALKVPRQKIEKFPVLTRSGKIVYEGKPGSALKRAQAAYDQEFSSRQLIDVMDNSQPGSSAFGQSKPGATATAPGKPGANVAAQSKPWAPNKPGATSTAPGKPGANVAAQSKPWAPNKPGATSTAPGKAGANVAAQSKPWAPNKPGATSTAPGKAGANVAAQSKPWAPNKPGATSTAPGKPGANVAAQSKPWAPNKPGATSTAPGKAGANVAAQSKPWAPNKPGATSTAPGKAGANVAAQSKPWAPNKPGATSTAPGKPGANVAAQSKPWAPNKPGATSTAPGKAGANVNAKSKPWAPNKPGATSTAPGKAGANVNAKSKPWAPNKPAATVNAQSKPSATVIAQSKPGASGITTQNSPVEEAWPDMDKVYKKTVAMLSAYFEPSDKVVKSQKHLDPELERAVRMEIEGISKTVWSCVSENVTLANLKRIYNTCFKRSIIYRLFTLHITQTAKVTFASSDKQPSLAACNEYFNARHGRVLLMEDNVALVLFDTSDAFKSTFNERDVVEIDGCKIQNFIPLDFDIHADELHKGIEDAIQTDNLDKLHSLVLNKAFIQGMPQTREIMDQRIDSNLPTTSGASKNLTSIDSSVENTKDVASNNDSATDETHANDAQESNIQSPKTLNTQSLEKLNVETRNNINKEAVVKNNTVTQKILSIKTVEKLNEDSRKELNAEKEGKSETQVDINSETQVDIKSETQHELDSEMQDEVKSETQEQLNSETQGDLNSETQDELNSDTRDELKLETQDDLNLETQDDLNSETQDESNSQPEQNTNIEGQKSMDEDMNEKIKDFLDDFQKVVNENEEIFMTEEDLEDIYL